LRRGGRLSEDPAVSVCLLEAGKDDDQLLIKVPFCTALMLPTPINNWAFETVPQPGLNGRRGYMPRGKAMGGSTSINAMVYTRGHPWDYDHWAALGNAGWSWSEVLPYFRKSEHNEKFEGEYHGQGGPLNVADLRSMNPFQQIYLEAARQTGFKLIDDFNGADQEGIGIYQVMQKNGERWNAARAYLAPHLASRPNLTVITRARARRVVSPASVPAGSSSSKAASADLPRETRSDPGGRRDPVAAVVDALGHRRRRGAAAVRHTGDPRPARGWQEPAGPSRLCLQLPRQVAGPARHFPGGGLRMMKEIGRYRRERTGMMTSNGAEGGGFLRRFPDSPAPDFQLHFVVGMIDSHARKLHLGHGYSCHVCLLRPKSVGTLALASADPTAAPRIDPNFFGHADDLDAMVDGFKLTRKLMDAPVLAGIRTGEVYTEGIHSDDAIREELRKRSDTIYHPVGTCKMGSDAMAVVDSRLRVHGLDGLRVVDASIMPTLIGGNTTAPTLMIAEKAADMIRRRCRSLMLGDRVPGSGRATPDANTGNNPAGGRFGGEIP
jgi:choline dehydrogenase-like flavoprotein